MEILRTGHHPDPRRRSPAVCPSKLKSRPAASTAAAFRYFPVVAGAARIRRRPAPPAAGKAPANRRGGTARISGTRIPPRAGAAAGDVRHPLHAWKTAKMTAPSMSPSSPPIRSPKPRARPKKSARELLFLEPDSNERPHLPDHLSRHLRHPRIGLEKYIEAYRVWPQERNEEVTAHAAGMAWKLQGADPEARIVAGSVAQPARSSARCDGIAAGAARAAPQDFRTSDC